MALLRCRLASEDRIWATGLQLSPHPLPPAKHTADFWTQLSVLSLRLLRNLYRHPFLIALNFAATLVTAIGLGLVFNNTAVDTGGIQNRSLLA